MTSQGPPLTTVSGPPVADARHVAPSHAGGDVVVQVRRPRRLTSDDGERRIVGNLADPLTSASAGGNAERATGNVRQADGDFGRRLEAAVQALRG